MKEVHFPPNSRYYNTAVETRTLPDGRTETFVARRLIPAPERHVAMDRVRLDGSERLDQLAARSIGDPALWWRIADASGEAEPATLTGQPGRLIIIPLPIEIADNGNA